MPVISDLSANVWSGMEVSFQDCPTGACESHECALKPPFAELRFHAQRRRLLGSSYVGLWHKADVQRLPGLGPLTGALPTFGAECLLTAAFQTYLRRVPKVGS